MRVMWTAPGTAYSTNRMLTMSLTHVQQWAYYAAASPFNVAGWNMWPTWTCKL